MVKVRISASYDNFNDGRKEGAGLSTKETISSRINDSAQRLIVHKAFTVILIQPYLPANRRGDGS
jgi:hypothetical protein